MSLAFGAPVISARFKVEPEDFIVREWLGFEPDGEGDFMLLTVRKRGANTLWVAKQLARFANCDARDVGFAGLKDRQAVTEQAYTVPSRNIAPEAWLGFTGEGFSVISAIKQRRKLRRGAHKGNDFEIVLRDVQGDAEALTQRLQLLKARGAPNYFGAQRFGRDNHNLLMADEWLVQGREIRDRVQRGFALSAARSLLFNAVLQERIKQGNWDQLLPGDLANLNGSNSVFAVGDVDETLQQRCLEFDIHPSGPLWGAGELKVSGIAAEIEMQVAAHHSALAAGLAHAGLEQERRALRVWVRDLQWTHEDSRLILRFRLHRGAFATAVLAELMGNEANALGRTKMLEEFQHGAVREIRLAKPPANAFTQPMVVELTQRLKAASADGARAIVLSGQPGMFSGGLDLPSLIRLDWTELQRFMRSGLAMQHQLANQSIPVVAAITGHCAAAGAVMAMFCDYRIMAAGSYKIGLNEVAVGLCPGRIAYQAMRRLIGARLADQLVTRGEFVEPARALEIGLVDQVMALDQVIPTAIAFAQSYANLPQQAMYESRRIARQDLVELCDAAMRDDSAELQKRWFGDEAQQGLRALAARLAGAAGR